MALPDFEGWALFAAVADHGGFRAAATANGVSVATVSKAIARLEARLGTALFHRSSRRVTLTLAGEALLDRARSVAASGVAVEEAAHDDAAQLSGPVRLTAPMSLGMACLGEPLAAFLARHPGVSIDLVLSDARCDLVADGIDLALRIGAEADSALRAQTIAPVPTAIVAAPAYVEQRGAPRHPDDLAGHQLLGYGHERRDTPIRLIGPGGERATALPNGPLLTNNGDVMLPLLRAGLAIAMLPRFFVADDLARGTLVPVLPGWLPPPITLSLVTPPSRLRPARVRALAAHLVDALRRAPMLAES